MNEKCTRVTGQTRKPGGSASIDAPCTHDQVLRVAREPTRNILVWWWPADGAAVSSGVRELAASHNQEIPVKPG